MGNSLHYHETQCVLCSTYKTHLIHKIVTEGLKKGSPASDKEYVMEIEPFELLSDL